MNFRSSLHFESDWPELSEHFASSVLVYDQNLAQHVPASQAWISQFQFKLGVTAGESLKDIKEFPSYIEKLLALVDQSPSPRPTLIALGGGSVGDFAGFCASVLKRGVDFIQIPSTLLSAIDSAHGGKTALNVAGAKNQVGTFYPAQEIYIIKSLFEDLPLQQRQEGFGELYKMALLQGGPYWEGFQKLKDLQWDHLWSQLPGAIEAKYEVILKDPYETSGVRQCLNLGHTMGHVFEAYQGLAHGVAVLLGLDFALQFSLHRGVMSSEDYQRVVTSTPSSLLQETVQALPKKKITATELHRLLQKDKKRAGDGTLHFILLKKPGEWVAHAMSYEEVIQEARRQNLVEED